MPENSGGKRERRKQETRRLLLLAAAKLIDEKGFADTTVQEIASKAEVSERTFFRYFQYKEDLLLQDLIQYFSGIESSLRRQPVEMEPIHALHRAIDESITHIPEHLLGRLLPDSAMTDAHVAARLVTLFTTLESSIASILDDRLQAVDPTMSVVTRKRHARLLAFCALGASRAALISFREENHVTQGAKLDMQMILNEAFSLLMSGWIISISDLHSKTDS
ncbi:MAG: TetR/AcrR family transcriptional regulator [Acidimicrobiales bacterium]